MKYLLPFILLFFHAWSLDFTALPVTKTSKNGPIDVRICVITNEYNDATKKTDQRIHCINGTIPQSLWNHSIPFGPGPALPPPKSIFKNHVQLGVTPGPLPTASGGNDVGDRLHMELQQLLGNPVVLDLLLRSTFSKSKYGDVITGALEADMANGQGGGSDFLRDWMEEHPLDKLTAKMSPIMDIVDASNTMHENNISWSDVMRGVMEVEAPEMIDSLVHRLFEGRKKHKRRSTVDTAVMDEFLFGFSGAVESFVMTDVVKPVQWRSLIAEAKPVEDFAPLSPAQFEEADLVLVYSLTPEQNKSTVEKVIAHEQWVAGDPVDVRVCIRFFYYNSDTNNETLITRCFNGSVPFNETGFNKSPNPKGLLPMPENIFNLSVEQPNQSPPQTSVEYDVPNDYYVEPDYYDYGPPINPEDIPPIPIDPRNGLIDGPVIDEDDEKEESRLRLELRGFFNDPTVIDTLLRSSLSTKPYGSLESSVIEAEMYGQKGDVHFLLEDWCNQNPEDPLTQKMGPILGIEDETEVLHENGMTWGELLRGVIQIEEPEMVDSFLKKRLSGRTTKHGNFDRAIIEQTLFGFDGAIDNWMMSSVETKLFDAVIKPAITKQIGRIILDPPAEPPTEELLMTPGTDLLLVYDVVRDRNITNATSAQDITISTKAPAETIPKENKPSEIATPKPKRQRSPHVISRRKHDNSTGTVFTCDRSLSSEPPVDVNHLRPSDIRVVAAMGDSITAGFGIQSRSLPEVLVNYRGLSYSIGGAEDLSTMVTVPNILRQYRSDIVGQSYSIGAAWFFRNAQFNVAVGGATSDDMLDQAKTLVKRITRDKRVNSDADWKLVTLFVGGNDLCEICQHETKRRPSAYVSNVKRALDYLRDNLKRTYVNLVNVVNVPALETVQYSVSCALAHLEECPCITVKYESYWPQLTINTREYQQGLHDLINEGRYEKDDFTVVVQPMLEDLTFPMKNESGVMVPDYSFIAQDCFHFNRKGHSAGARLLWNNMVTPIGQKQKTIDDANWNMPLKCPAENCPYLRTQQNSGADCDPLPLATPPPTPSPEEVKEIEYGKFLEKLAKEELRALNASQFDDAHPWKGVGPYGAAWTCDFEDSVGSPDVHHLHPSDIRVVAAMGDGTMLGNGIDAKSFAQILVPRPGLAFAIGGDEYLRTMVTLPNILQETGDPGRLKGVSEGILVAALDTRQLNMAEAEATSENMEDQAKALVERMRNNTDIILSADWKLVTIFVGVNDLCNSCDSPIRSRASSYVSDLRDALDYLHDNLNNTFVNLVSPPNVAAFETAQINGLCEYVHKKYCPCVVHSEADGYEDLNDLIGEYQTELKTLIDSDRYDDRPDFTVVLQPMLEQATFPTVAGPTGPDPELSFLSPDCFHLSRKGQSALGRWLWNNMVTPVHKKTRHFNQTDWNMPLQCVDPSCPFLRTKQNSVKCSIPNVSFYGLITETGAVKQQTAKQHTGREATTAIVVLSLVVILLGVALSLFIMHSRKKQQKSNRRRSYKLTERTPLMSDVDSDLGFKMS